MSVWLIVMPASQPFADAALVFEPPGDMIQASHLI